jgi:hypothetical protein
LTPPNPSDFIENENEWLRKPPFQVTNNNKNFVIVGSAPDETSGKAAIEMLKLKHPQYDFALYAPYDGNTNYGIMMATWAPSDIAKKALAVARTINPKAYIWSCRSLRNTCWYIDSANGTCRFRRDIFSGSSWTVYRIAALGEASLFK